MDTFRLEQAVLAKIDALLASFQRPTLAFAGESALMSCSTYCTACGGGCADNCGNNCSGTAR